MISFRHQDDDEGGDVDEPLSAPSGPASPACRLCNKNALVISSVSAVVSSLGLGFMI